MKAILSQALRIAALMVAVLLALVAALAWQGRMVIGWPEAIALCIVVGLALGMFVALIGSYFDRTEHVRSMPMRLALVVLPVMAMLALFYWMQRH